jgi:DNA-binding transcriptional MerR regulator
MLTIGQLADYVGVTIRAVRHYHQRGLLPEPDRDASGYRRYDADSVIELIRIKALADAGVPLARIQQLLGAEPAEFAAAVAEIDTAMAARIRELQAQRRRVAELAAGDRLFVPPEIADLFEKIRGLGISPEAMRIERDAWILFAARFPGQARNWAQIKLAALDDTGFQQIYRDYYQAFDWDADDPRLELIADAMLDYAEHHRAEVARHQVSLDQVSAVPTVADPVAMALVLSRTATMPPAWERLDQLCAEKARARGLVAPPAPPAGSVLSPHHPPTHPDRNDVTSLRS